MKIVFFGTPDFAVPSLEAAVKAGHTVTAVVSQPDKPKGRGKKVVPTPMKAAAIKLGIAVLQPDLAKTDEFFEEIKKYEADIFVVAAYGQLLPERLLNLPKYGSINIHGSLLPKYRGAAPMQQAIIDGEKVTGVTIMYMAKKLDAGDMLLKKSLPIEDYDTFETLHDKMAVLGSEALIEALELIESGKAVREKQDDSLSTYAHKITKETGRLDFSKNSEEIVNLIRGLNPYPAAYTTYEGETLKIFKAHPLDIKHEGNNGSIISADKKGIVVKTGNGAVCITEIQAAGSKKMDVSAYLLGHKIEKGKTLGA